MTKEELKLKDLADYWLEQIELGLKYKKDYSSSTQWDTYRKWFRGDFGDFGAVNQTVVNRVFSYIKSALPRIYFRAPAISCTPRRPEFAEHARTVEAVDNWLLYETRVKGQIKSAILDAMICGTGVLKHGYDSEYGYIPEQGVGQDASTATQVGVKSGEAIEYHNAVAPGMPWSLRVRPDEIITPYGYADPESLPWVCHRFIRPVKDVQEDQKYDAKYRKEIKGGFSVGMTENRSLLKDNKADFALLYEIREKKTRSILVICEGKVLINKPDTLQIDRLPFDFLIFNEDPEHFWGMSDVEAIAPQQKELIEIRTQASLNRRLSMIKFFFQKGSLTQDNLEKLLSTDPADIGAGIEVITDSLASAVLPMQPHALTNDLLKEQERTEADMRDTMGFSLNQQGEYTPFHNKTATEANIVSQASSIRSDERRDAVADLLANMLRTWNQYVFKFWDKERVIEVAGPTGAATWVTYTGPQLKGEYQLIINPETGMPVTRQLRQQIATEMYKMFNNDPLIDQIGLRRLVLQQTDLLDPAYQMLVRQPPPAPQTPGEMPGMPGVAAAGGPVSSNIAPGTARPAPDQPPTDPNAIAKARMQAMQNMQKQQGQQQHQARMSAQQHQQTLQQQAQAAALQPQGGQ